MVEGEKGSRQVNGSSGSMPRQRRSAAPEAGEDAGQPPPGDLTQLLAAVGALLEGHAADDLVVMLREELERREFAAYGRGWRDAAAQYHQLVEMVGRVRTGETGGRVPGQAAVIPFRRRERYDRPEFPQLRPRAGGPEQADPYRDPHRDSYADPHRDQYGDPLHRTGAHRVPPLPADPPEPDPAAPRGTARTAPPGPRPPRGSRLRPSAPDAAADPSPGPAFAPKNRRSKVPTIPRLSGPRDRDRPDGDG
ncbi:hypothetical protein OG217_16770 [Streptomyces sp. NBC_01023]|uniref:hypothetical protein n=1 Tax=Streptomyces sp. NBC_01023 TaxID=2903724 RepID=UPI00386C0997|nr:hypothetical protein OG217_16770 [Streptomyces sp. NBC_01023]